MDLFHLLCWYLQKERNTVCSDSIAYYNSAICLSVGNMKRYFAIKIKHCTLHIVSSFYLSHKFNSLLKCWNILVNFISTIISTDLIGRWSNNFAYIEKVNFVLIIIYDNCYFLIYDNCYLSHRAKSLLKVSSLIDILGIYRWLSCNIFEEHVT